MQNNTHAGASAYNPITLKLYDWWVLKVSNRYAWRCPTDTVLLPHFKQHIGNKHLDIGVGTGYYLPHLPAHVELSLLDLNASSLQAASAKAGDKVKDCLKHDVFQPLPLGWNDRFDSISLFYLLHCLPGSLNDKAQAIENIARALKKEGTLFGATILGDGVTHNAFGNKLMKVYNKKGIFANRSDSEAQLRDMLLTRFARVEVKTVGVVALFSASEPRAIG
ncbi:class I SAM-dependent methyltransferase [Cedecea neteri]|uniref:class I SAM-dependent methyltransferase n=1 Tax=Cedecea neteri TaxID=158822 RepID=UPI002892C497|nr:class I SAM-dependent methyltransferase [Cedecea neteri]WNJ77462.1 class I SAM-dependent methyltransferase [Cedecea neteri]